MPPPEETLSEIARLIRRDPARRGIAGIEVAGEPLAPRGLVNAAQSLAKAAESVVISTGFYVPGPEGPRAETDGPPGALFLAQALQALGIEVTLLTDSVATAALRFGCELVSLEPAMVMEFPFEAPQVDSPARESNEAGNNAVSDVWVEQFISGELGKRLTHLVAVERAGPSHTTRSMRTQPRQGAPPKALFLEVTSEATRNRCLNMRAESINRHTAKVHRLFEVAASKRPDVTTIGIVDGGNEIGCGTIPWEVLHASVPNEHGGQIACRTATDHTILAGVSNWGAYALAAACLHLRGETSRMRDWNAKTESKRIERLVSDGRLIDGVTRLSAATVDGLPLETYLQALSGIRRAVGLQP